MRNVGVWIAIVGLGLSVLGMAWNAGATASELRTQVHTLRVDLDMTREENRAMRAEITQTRLVVERLCALTPGCGSGPRPVAAGRE